MTRTMINFDPESSSNPYLSPQVDLGTSPLPHFTYSDRFPTARLVERTRMTRTVYVHAPLDVSISYRGNGFGYESVLVDGVLACRETSKFWFVPHFAFLLRTKAGDFPATLDVNVSWKFKVARFCIHIEGELIYAEE